MTHRTELRYDAGIRTYSVHCETCGRLRGIALTRRDAEAKGAAHRAEMKRADSARARDEA